MKICLKCNKSKNPSEFSKNRAKKDGLDIYCKDCLCDINRKVYYANREEKVKSARRYRLINKDNPTYIKKRKKYNDKYRKLYPDKIKLTRDKNRAARNLARKKKREILKKTNPEIALFESTQYRARKRGIPHNLKLSDVVIPEKCPVLGIPLFPGKKFQCDNSPSVDRIDNSKGYTKENIVIVSWRVNNIKSNATVEELRKITNFYEKLE